MNGIVYLVGAGPGAPGLMTLRAAALVRRAEVLVYDYLAAPEILDMAPKTCRRIYVGKMSGNHARPQAEINRLLIEEARAGRVVVRLKGGDPYIFGRGGEEGLELAAAGVAFEETPGVSSTVAAAAYAGIPLTHRGLSSQAVLITGHERSGQEESAHDWEALARMGTISMVMGVRNLDCVCGALIRAGRDKNTPAALIQWGTTSRQRTLTGVLETLPRLAAEQNIAPPALFVAGEVVRLREKLNWFETRPLFGRCILVTRSREQASRLAGALDELGAEVWERPTIAIEPLNDPAYLKETFSSLPDYDWLIFTSPNGVKIFMEALWAGGADARALAGLKIAVIGPATAEALKPFGLKADLEPGRDYSAEGLLEVLKETGLKNQKMLLIRAMEGREVLPAGLREAGAAVTDRPVYKTVNPIWSEKPPDAPDLVTFTSSSTAAGLAAFIPLEERARYRAVSIGPATTRMAKSLGFPVVAEAEKSTIDSLVRAVVQCCGAAEAPRGSLLRKNHDPV